MKVNSALGLLIGAALVVAAPAGAQGVKAGIEAWQNGDWVAAVAAWRPLAAQGDADAAFNLGQAYRLGKGVPLDLAKAQGLFEQAARKGHVDASTVLGILLFQNGNRTGAMRWLKKAADAGDARAMLLFGTALYNGDGIATDPVTAYAYVSRAAAQGLDAAKATLADLDSTLDLAERQKGVALAKAMVVPKAGPATLVATAKPEAGKPAPSAKVASRPGPAVPAPIAASGKWRIQLGAFGQRSTAEALFARVGGKLAGRSAIYVPVGKVVRLQVGPFESRAAAAAACAKLAGQACFPVAP
jgi:cell division septation protein DedD